MKSRYLLGAATLITLVSAGFGGQVGFEEDFALAPDRSVPLQQLIVGTPDYYYYPSSDGYYYSNPYYYNSGGSGLYFNFG